MASGSEGSVDLTDGAMELIGELIQHLSPGARLEAQTATAYQLLDGLAKLKEQAVIGKLNDKGLTKLLGEFALNAFAQLALSEKRLDGLEEEREQTRIAHGNLQQDHEMLSQRLTGLLLQQDQLSVAASEAKERVAKLESENDLLRKSTANPEPAVWQGEKKDLLQRLQESQEHCIALKAEVYELLDQKGQGDKRLAQAQNELDHLKADQLELVARHKFEANRALEKLNRQQDECNALQQRVQELDTELLMTRSIAQSNAEGLGTQSELPSPPGAREAPLRRNLNLPLSQQATETHSKPPISAWGPGDNLPGSTPLTSRGSHMNPRLVELLDRPIDPWVSPAARQPDDTALASGRSVRFTDRGPAWPPSSRIPQGASYPAAPRTTPPSPGRGLASGFSGIPDRDLEKIAKIIPKFDPSKGGHDLSAYLNDIEFYLRKFPAATVDDRVYIIRASSTREVVSFLQRQPFTVQNDYNALCAALRVEFEDPGAETGLTAAMNVTQGKQESPLLYYQRLRKAFFGPRNEPGMEEDINFKSLFVRNLHPTTSQPLGIGACPRTMSSSQLREMAMKGFTKNRQAPHKQVEAKTVFDLGASGAVLELEGAPRALSTEPSARTRYGKQGRQQSRRPNQDQQRDGRYRNQSGFDSQREKQTSPQLQRARPVYGNASRRPENRPQYTDRTPSKDDDAVRVKDLERLLKKMLNQNPDEKKPL